MILIDIPMILLIDRPMILLIDIPMILLIDIPMILLIDRHHRLNVSRLKFLTCKCDPLDPVVDGQNASHPWRLLNVVFSSCFACNICFCGFRIISWNQNQTNFYSVNMVGRARSVVRQPNRCLTAKSNRPRPIIYWIYFILLPLIPQMTLFSRADWMTGLGLLGRHLIALNHIWLG